MTRIFRTVKRNAARLVARTVALTRREAAEAPAEAEEPVEGSVGAKRKMGAPPATPVSKRLRTESPQPDSPSVSSSPADVSSPAIVSSPAALVYELDEYWLSTIIEVDEEELAAIVEEEAEQVKEVAPAPAPAVPAVAVEGEENLTWILENFSDPGSASGIDWSFAEGYGEGYGEGNIADRVDFAEFERALLERDDEREESAAPERSSSPSIGELQFVRKGNECPKCRRDEAEKARFRARRNTF